MLHEQLLRPAGCGASGNEPFTIAASVSRSLRPVEQGNGVGIEEKIKLPSSRLALPSSRLDLPSSRHAFKSPCLQVALPSSCLAFKSPCLQVAFKLPSRLEVQVAFKLPCLQVALPSSCLALPSSCLDLPSSRHALPSSRHALPSSCLVHGSRTGAVRGPMTRLPAGRRAGLRTTGGPQMAVLLRSIYVHIGHLSIICTAIACATT